MRACVCRLSVSCVCVLVCVLWSVWLVCWLCVLCLVRARVCGVPARVLCFLGSGWVGVLGLGSRRVWGRTSLLCLHQAVLYTC